MCFVLGREGLGLLVGICVVPDQMGLLTVALPFSGGGFRTLTGRAGWAEGY